MSSSPSGAPWDPGLQSERTALAWVRTGLGQGGVSLLLTRLVPDSGATALVVGLTGLLAAGVLVSVQSSRHRRQEARLHTGHLPPSTRACLALTAGVVALAAAALVLVVRGPG